MRLEQLDRIALLAELGLWLAMRANLGRRLARPLTQGHVAHVERFGVLGMGLLGPLAVQAVDHLLGGPTRLGTALVSLLALSGGYALRYVLVMAGRQSADDPEATFELTRAKRAPA
jgi:hypothetical protein